MMEYVVAYISVFISFWGYLIMYKIITNSKIYFHLKNILLYCLLVMISVIIGFQNSVLLNLLSNLLIISIILKMFYRITYKNCYYYSIITFTITLISDALFSLLLSNKYLSDFDKLLNNTYLRLVLMIPVIFVSLLICNLFKKYINIFFEKYFNKIKINRIKIFLILLIIISIIVIFALNGYNKVDKLGHVIIIICTLLLSLLFISVLYLLYHEYQITQVNRKIIEENNYIKGIAKQEEEFKHNLVNNLLGIKTIANKKTKKLIDELINDYKQDYKNITNINDLPNGVQSIIYRKAYEENIEDLNLIVDNSIEKELYDILSPRKYNHLCTSIGILFDNALDAVRNTSEKVIEIIFLEDNGNIYFILKNSFSNFIDLEEIGKKSVTTKIGGHGIGVNYVANLKTLEMKNEIINNMFVSKLIIKKTKKYS